MNPNLCRVTLRPRDPLEVFDLTVLFFRAGWWSFARLSLWTILPWSAIFFFASWWTEGHWGTLIGVIVVSPLLQVPFTILGGRLLFADSVALRDVGRETLVSVRRLIPVWVIGAGAWILSAATCFYGTVFFQAFLLYLSETALLEKVEAQRGLKRSIRLASGHLGIALVGASARWILLLWLALMGEVAGQALVDFVLQLGQPFGSLSNGEVTPFLLIGALCAQPVFAIYRLLLYVDIRTRVEGWDLQVALRALGMVAK